MKWKRELLFALIGGAMASLAVLSIRPAPNAPDLASTGGPTLPGDAGDELGQPVMATFTDDLAGEGIYIECRLSMSGTGDEAAVTGRRISGRIWLLGQRVRVELDAEGTLTTTIVNGEGTYRLLPSRKVALSLPSHEQNPAAGTQSLSFLNFADPFDPHVRLKNPRTIGSETLLGIDCDIWTGDAPPSPMLLAISKTTIDRRPRYWLPRTGRPHFPLKAVVRSAAADAPAGGLLVVTRLALGQAIPKEMFDLPDGYSITR
jgi:hypothetical protein